MTCCAGVCTGLCGDRSKIGTDLRTGKVVGSLEQPPTALAVLNAFDTGVSARLPQPKTQQSRGGSSAKRNAPRQPGPNGVGMETDWFAAKRRKARRARELAKAAKRRNRT